MDNKKKDGYLAGLATFVVGIIFLVVSINSQWTTLSGQIFWAITVIFFILSAGSILRPESIGSVVMKYFENFGEKDTSSSKETSNQSQEDSSRSVQVIGNNNIINNNITPVEKIVPNERAKQLNDEKPEQIERELKIDEVNESSILLLADADVTKFGINNILLDKIYEQAYLEAAKIYDDVQLNSLSIQVIPFATTNPKFTFMFVFYSKNVNKICYFAYHDGSEKVVHSPPNKEAKFDSQKIILTTLPWRERPHWMLFVNKAYDQIKQLCLRKYSSYSITVRPGGWLVDFEDVVSGAEHKFKWIGDGLDKNSIKQED
jgi:hypothetical protein